ncbi:putative transcriptional regulatory protein [Nostocoides japonicum T1-X7]|uniref:Putative transcriptional regulatory protein n=1 Tax=Nostocoides japonicum T1-X7 TaxID=1194083 RepID=A0A077LYG3_9MICO|nr:Rv2175c family DNA-binding protein [Tetrasphaera japonica]CCH78958.1 putative transcriptional regulatory protein [Tetrasphaera japonica T1-X7]
MTDRVDAALESLAAPWVTVPDLAERLGIRLADVRRLIEDRVLLAGRIGERAVVAVPEAFLDEEGPLASLRGTFTVLADGGMDDAEILRWLFSPAEVAGGTPIAALQGGRKTEVRRLAMETAW